MNNNTDMTVNEAVVQKMEELRKAGRVNSWYRYRSMLHALESYGGACIAFEEVTPSWLSGCESAWRASGRSSTTISIYMKSLRCIFHLHRGSSGPFASYRIPRPSSRHMALTSSGIRAVLQWSGSDGPLAESRDLWLFSYLCNGINFKDMLQLRYSDIRDGEIEFVRSKTRFSAGGTVVRAHLSPVMREIIARRGTGEGRVAGNRYIFRYLHGDETPFQLEKTVRRVIRRCNSDMRKLAEELRNTFQAKANKADREFNAKYQKFEKDMMDAQDKIQKGLVTRATAEQMQQQLMQQQQELMETRDRMMGELAEEEQVMNNRIYFAVTDYLKEYNADYKYAMILSTAAGTGPVLHADPSLDITKEVLAGLNARYEAEKSGK